MYTKSMGTCPPSSVWGLPAFTVPSHHAPVPEKQGPDAHGKHAVACGERSAGSAPARGTGHPCFFSRSIIHSLCKSPRNMDKGEGESPRDPFPEMAHISSDYVFLISVECPPAPFLGHFLLCSCRTLSITFVNSANRGHQATSAFLSQARPLWM